MGLSVRLRHAVGERVLELPDRGVDNPVTVGRAADVELKIPSIGVGPQHLVLFAHEGEWVVQDAPGSTGTTINGAPLEGARVLRPGDVLTLGAGPSAPAIEIEPIGLTSDAPAAAGLFPASSSLPAFPATHPAAAIESPPAVLPAYAPADYAQPGAPNEDAPAEPHPPVADEAAWMTAPPTAAYRTPRRKPASGAAAGAFAGVVALCILGAAGYFLYNRIQQRNTPAQPVATTFPSPAPASRPAPRTIFNDAPRPATRAVSPPRLVDVTDDFAAEKTGVAAEMPEPSLPQIGTAPARPGSRLVGSPGAAAAAAPGDADADWKRVESAYYNTDPAKALLAFDAYAEEKPDRHLAELAQYREDLLDKLWWKRVDSLFDKQKELADGVKKTEQLLKDKDEEPAYKKAVLEPRLVDQKARLQAAVERLTKDMGYQATTPPPIGDDAAMIKLREKRDPKTYDAWKKRVVKHIRDNHGAYPWANER